MRPRKLALLAVAASMLGTTAVGVTASAAYANTACVAGQNAGYSNGGSGDMYWGWCHPNGGYVRYRIMFDCNYTGDAFTSDWASGAGWGAIYTNAHYCPGGVAPYYVIQNG
jgi:hypothetical protein